MAFNVGEINAWVKLNYDGKGLTQLDKDMKKAEKSTGRMTDAAGRLGGKLKGGLKVGAAAAGTAIAGGLVLGLKQAVTEAREAEKVMRLTNNAIKASGGVANVTAKEISNLSTSLSNKTAIDDEAIQSSANLLLTFRNIRNEAGKNNDIFNQATETALDMAQAYGMDVPSATKMLAKALQDPANAASALKRSGAIDETGVQAIKKMAEDGASNLEMQKRLLNDINKAGVKGAAAAAADPLQRVRVIINNLLEDIGTKLLPYINKAADALSKFALQFMKNKGAGGEFRRTLADILEVVRGLMPTLKTIGSVLLTVLKGFAGLSPTMKTVIGAFAGFLAIGLKLAAFFRVAPLMMGPVGIAIGLIGMAAILLIQNWGAVKKFLGKVWNWIKNAFSDVASTVMNLAKKGFLGPIPFILSRWKDILGFIRSMPGKISSFLSGLGSIILTPFKWAAGKIKGVFDSIVNAIRKAIDKVKSVIGGVGGVVGDIGGFVGKVIPGLAKGGPVDQASLFVAGEAGKEWVISQDPSVRKQNQGYVMEAASALGIPMFAKGGKVGERLNTKVGNLRNEYDLKRRQFELSGGRITGPEFDQLIRINEKIEKVLQKLVEASSGQARREARFALRAARMDRKDLLREKSSALGERSASTPGIDYELEDLQTQLALAEGGYGGNADAIRTQIKAKLEGKLQKLRDRLANTTDRAQASLIRQSIQDTLSALSSIGSGGSSGPSIIEQTATASALRFQALSQFGSNAMQFGLGSGGKRLAGAGGTNVFLNGEFKLDSNDPHNSVRKLGYQIANNL